MSRAPMNIDHIRLLALVSELASPAMRRQADGGHAAASTAPGHPALGAPARVVPSRIPDAPSATRASAPLPLPTVTTTAPAAPAKEAKETSAMVVLATNRTAPVTEIALLESPWDATLSWFAGVPAPDGIVTSTAPEVGTSIFESDFLERPWDELLVALASSQDAERAREPPSGPRSAPVSAEPLALLASAGQ